MLGIVFVGLLTLPEPLRPPEGHLTGSWELGLVMAAHDHLHFGGDVIWTYGPLGRFQVLTLWFGREWAEALAVTVAVHAALIAAIAGLLVARRAPWSAWGLVGLVFVAPSAILPSRSGGSLLSVEYELLLLGIVLLLLGLSTPSRRRAVAAGLLAGLALGCAALVKQTDLAVSAVTIAVAAAAARWLAAPRWWAAAVAGPAAVAGITTAWFASGQDVADIGPYLRGSLSAGIDYRAALGSAGVSGALLLALLEVIAVVGLFVMAAISGRRQVALAALLVLPLLAVSIEEAYVRADPEHTDIFLSVMAMTGAILAVEVASPDETGTVAVSGGVAPARWFRSGAGALRLPALLAALNCALLLSGDLAAPPATLVARAREWPDAVRDMLDPAAASTVRASLQAAILAEYQVEPGAAVAVAGSTVDVMPWQIDLLWALGAQWDPRPVLATYGSDNAYLDGRDADHLLGPARPQHLVYRVGTVDGRYQPFDEPLTLQAVLREYTVERGHVSSGEEGDFLLLRARPTPLADDRLPEGSTCAPLGDPIPVPQVAGRLVEAAVHLPYSLRGTLAGLVFKPDNPTVKFTVEGGETGTYRWVQAQGPSGMLVGELVTSNDDMAALFGGKVVHPVTAMTIDSPSRAEFGGTVCADFWSTSLPSP